MGWEVDGEARVAMRGEIKIWGYFCENSPAALLEQQ